MEDRFEASSTWFKNRVQELEMALRSVKEELRLSMMQLEENERERTGRIQSMITYRGLDISHGSFAADEEHMRMSANPDMLLEKHLDRAQQLQQQVHMFQKQIDSMEQQLKFANKQLLSQGEELLEEKKQAIKMQREVEKLKESLASSQNENSDLLFQLQDAQALAREDNLVFEMTIREHTN